MSGMSHAKQAAARQECSTGILKSRRYWKGAERTKGGTRVQWQRVCGVGNTQLSHSPKLSDDAITDVSICLQFAHNSFQDTAHLFST